MVSAQVCPTAEVLTSGVPSPATRRSPWTPARLHDHGECERRRRKISRTDRGTVPSSSYRDLSYATLARLWSSRWLLTESSPQTFATMISLGEMVSHLPLPGGHITLAQRFVDPAFSFTSASRFVPLHDAFTDLWSSKSGMAVRLHLGSRSPR
jgi:hypothetical protein